MNIIVTGGSGLVGKHLKDILPDAVYISSKDFDLTDIDRVDAMMDYFRPKVVVHLAARVGGIMDNISYPVNYIEDRVISVLSSCIYPDVVKNYPMKEDELFNGPPPKDNFAYAMSKRCMATHMDAYIKQYNKRWCYLIPCNMYGEYDKYEEHHSHFISALVKKIYEAKDSVEIWGSGKPLRQFMHAEDLARVIKYMIDNDIVDNFNVEPNFNYSIQKMTTIGLEDCGKELGIVYDNTKPDGQYRKDIDSSKLLSVLKDFEFISLKSGIRRVYDNFSKRYN